ncbi:MAG: NAD(P)/FAD-dependent oxidoreductase [Eubacteriales bacterium]|nr:NAD(P)/FAD-dependent oxidoreductase [Eubacteriales bacterium]
MVYDIAIIGAGVVGTQIARNFSKYDLKVALLEKESDIAMGTTKANSGIVHAGFDCETGTRMAELNVKGCRMMEELATTLHVPYEKNGSLVVAFSEEEMATIQDLYMRGIANGLTRDELKIIERDELVEMEPNIADEAYGALYAPTAGIVSPYELAIGAAECAILNGVEFLRKFNVGGIVYEDGVFILGAKDGRVIRSKFVVNSAGIFASYLLENYNGEKFKVIPRKGEYGLLDRSVYPLVTHTIFQCPTEMGKGILVAPTTHHNVFVGPTSLDQNDNMEGKHDVSVRDGALRHTYAEAQKSVPSVSPRDQITSFAGLRAHWIEHDFYIAPAKNNKYMINLIGIESPGLASSPAIAEVVENMVLETMDEAPAKKADWNPSRKAPVFFRTMSPEERAELIAKDPAYSRIVCRCETVTEGEIRDAIRAPGGAIDLDGVKRRTRAGMGRCQGGFCGSKVMEILAEELDMPINEITKFGRHSDIIYERTK